jgi:hypothetical protein
MDSVLPYITFVFGGGLTALVLKIWDRSHPETQVTYEIHTSRIPMPTTPGNVFDTFSEIVFRNPNRRVRATKLNLTVTVPTTEDVYTDAIETPEDPGSMELSELEAPVGTPCRVMRLRAERLAPRSYITLKIWYSGAEGSLLVSGAADQAVLRNWEGAPSGLAFTPPFAAFLVLSGMLAYLVGFVTSGPRSSTLASWHVPPSGVRVAETVRELPTRPPSPPRLDLADADTLRVESDPGSHVVLFVSDKQGGEYRVYTVLLEDEHVVRLKRPHPGMSLAADASNTFGTSKRAYLRLPAR